MAASWGTYLIFPFYIVEEAGADHGWQTEVIESLGFDIANGRWDEGRWYFTLSGAKVLSTEIDQWDAFQDAVRGAANPFLFRMQTRRFEINQQVIGTGNGSNTVFQLQKTRSIQGISSVENIYYPWHDYPAMTFASGVQALKTEYVRIWVNDVEKTNGTDFTVNRYTGVVTLTSAPTSGYSVKASCKYMILVRGSDRMKLRSAGGESWEFQDGAELKEVRI